MIDKLIFLNATWNWPIILGSTVLLLVFIWKEWDQFGNIRFYIKILVAFFAILSLAMIALKPAFLNTENSRSLILLTEGYEQTSLDSLKKEYKNIKVLKYFADSPITKELTSVDSVLILGHGIKSYDLWQLEGKATKYIGGEKLVGITKFNYQKEQFVGDKAVFKGLYSQSTQGTSLILEGAGGEALDSVILLKDIEQGFQLQSVLKSAGNFVFNLVEKDSLGTLLTSNPIPITVKKKETLKILMINGFPTFETKYLKNFLAEMNHEVIVKSQVTTGKYKYEAFNTEKTTLGKLSEKLLEGFDLLIIDFHSFKTLSTSEKNAVESSIRDYGLGVFIQPEAELFRFKLRLTSFDFIQDRSVAVSMQENISLKKYPFVIKPSLSLQPIQNSGKRIISASKRIGQGKIGTSVLENTYELLLVGHTSEYQQLWTNLINVISKRAVPLVEWSSDSKMGVLHEPFQFQVRTLEQDPIIVNPEGAVIPLIQEMSIPNLWTGVTYPKNIGWQQVSLQLDSNMVYKYYVSNPKDWKTVAAFNRIKENIWRSSSVNKTTRKITQPIAINLLYFYLLFLFSIGYLWLEPKMRSY